MKTIAFLLIVYIVFLISSYYFRNKMIYVKSKWLYLFILAYLIAINFYYELFNQLDEFLTNKKIYLELGHANILLLLLYLFSNLTAIAIIISIFYKRRKIFSDSFSDTNSNPPRS
jgi:hypothetical protein